MLLSWAKLVVVGKLDQRMGSQKRKKKLSIKRYIFFQTGVSIGPGLQNRLKPTSTVFIVFV